MSARFALGIDLGTTNTVVACAPLGGPAPVTRVFDMPQLVARGEVAARPLFPSALYAPSVDERVTADPFADLPWVLGEHARRRGAEVPGRVVMSSKSWLAHAEVDRTAAILPWGGPDDLPKLSPVDAAARLLEHVRRAWDAQHPDAPLAEQEVVLTVPASFDEVARELTIEAARRAGIAPKLLEEPQAAFYDWMTRAARGGLATLLASAGGDALVLVVDVGGGTTDLSLMRVTGVDRVDRVAVGPHLLLGGDNMDLALAHACEPRLIRDGAKLEAASFAQLVAACRAAKEALLGQGDVSDAPVTLLGSGSNLVGGARSTRLTRDETERIVLDGFFPDVPADAKPQRARGGLVSFGLPYERDAAITRHVAAFLAKHLSAEAFPHAVLLNGGVFRSKRVAEHLLASLAAWRHAGPIERLAEDDPDLAVARGAVAYGLARLGRGVRIGGGSARGYFIGIAGIDRNGVSRAPGPLARAVCVVPRGAEEGQAHAARDRTFALALGRPVRFDLFASDTVDAREGEVVDVDEGRFSRLPPLAATVGEKSEDEVQVSIAGELTPVGTLDLACVEVDATRARRYRLAFELRGGDARVSRPPLALSQRPSQRIASALTVIDRVFGKPRADAGAREAKDVLRELERNLGARTQWTTETNRALYDVLIENAAARRRSADHERLFWLLSGFCIRPGFGDPMDARRISALGALFPERLAFPGEARGWQQFWIAWRRAAGGMDDALQTKVRDLADAYLAPSDGTRKRAKKPALSLDDALDMASSLERVAVPRRVELGGWVIERTWTDRDPRLWAAVGRIGARVPAYASIHQVVPSQVAERWLDHLLREKWPSVPTAIGAATQLARKTGDRARDVADAVCREVERRLVAAGADERWVRAVREVVPVDEAERAAFYGESLPLGLRLVS
jgi:molecular chaperone DnaK (HSP70)